METVYGDVAAVPLEKGVARHQFGLLPGPPRTGVDADLEEQADRILKADRDAFYAKGRNPGGQFLPHGILSEEQLKLRQGREVLTDRMGTQINYGLFRRAYNPLMGKRPTNRTWMGSSWGDLDYDARIAGGSYVVGWDSATTWMSRDKGSCPISRRYWEGLDVYQRSRIRAQLRGVPVHQRGEVVAELAAKYGVSPYTIRRLGWPPSNQL